MGTAFFTGHRDITPANRNDINKLIDTALDFGVQLFLTGMALGTDQLAAEILIQRNLHWKAVIPCPDQDKKWSYNQKREYKQLLEKAPSKIILFSEYSQGVLNNRNTWMANNSEICLAVYDGRKHGGTAHAVKEARAKNLTIISFNPLTNEFSVQHPPKQLTLF